ncbi:MAG: glycosyltransferase family 39 protein [Phascolarctobacterium sp.]|nr:glycosyltransferase family 39 protein [Phascolarctobacterium sp.]
MNKKYWLFLLIAAITLLFVGNGSLLITDNVESNYALTAKEMVLSGDWLSPQIYGKYWYDKPIFFYWLTALGFKLFGFTEFGARFFPSLFGLASLGLISWGASKIYGKKAAFYSAFMLLTSVEFFLISKSIITDSALFFFFSGTLLFFYLGYQLNRTKYWYLMYMFAGLATLTKGPIGFLLPGLIITLFLIWQKDFQVLTRCKLFSGVLLFLIVCMPWYLAMYAIHGMDFINGFLGTHNFLRATVSEHPKDDVIYYYTLVNILAIFPWTALIPMALYKQYKVDGFKIQPTDKFLIIWALTIFFFFQNMATKYITYTYPLLFPTFLYLGHYVAEKENVMDSKFCKAFVCTFFSILLIAAIYVDVKDIVVSSTLFLVPVSLIVGAFGYKYLSRHNLSQAVRLGSMAFIFYLALIISIAIPLAEKRSAKDVGLYLKQQKITDLAVYGKYSTSAVFYGDFTMQKVIKESDVEEYLPQQYSWTAKNVMPYKVLEEGEFKTVILEREKMNDFMEESDYSWYVKGRINDTYVLGRSS